MDPKERELRQKLSNLLEEARNYLSSGNLEEAKNKKGEAQRAREELDTYLELRGMTPQEPVQEPVKPTTPQEPSNRDNEPQGPEYRSVLCKALRNEVLTVEERQVLEENRALSSKTGEDGGYTIPIDQDTRINELKRDFTALENFVTVEPVTTLSGSRILEKEADITPFADFDEETDVPDSDSPQFVKLEYNIKDRGGFLPIPNNLLNDSNQNLMLHIEKWVKKKDKATKNKVILGLIETLTKKAIKVIDDIKDVLNVGLDPAIEAGAIIITNQDGYNYLDKQKDSEGKYLLQPDPTQPGVKLLAGKPVYKISNKILKTTGTTTKKAPIIIGDLKEAIVLFDRQQLSILSTNIGGTAFRKNRTEMRAINRVDVQKFDGTAAVYGEITLGA